MIRPAADGSPRLLDHAKRLLLLRRIFAARLGPRGYANLAGFALRRFLLKRDVPPVSVMIALTYQCQCECVHCAVSLAPREREELSTAEIASLIEASGRVGAIKIGFTGGEPLLRRDLAELVACARANGLSNSIDTNGLLLNERRAYELERAGITNVNVSLDHPEAARHDRLRRSPGCFEAALRAVENCTSVGIPCVVSTYLTDRSMCDGSLRALARLSKSRGAAALRVLFPIYSGKFKGRQRALLSRENQEAFFRDFVDPSFVYSESPFYDFLSGRMECSMLKRLSVYVTPYGDVKPCYVSDCSVGNIRDSRLEDILVSPNCRGSKLEEFLDCQSC